MQSTATLADTAGPTGTGDGATDRSLLVLLGGVASIGLGMALVIAGILVPSLFRPGTFAIGMGLLLAAAGGALRIASSPRTVPR